MVIILTFGEWASSNFNLFPTIIFNLIFQPGGSLVITTISQTALSYAAAIVGAEYILRLVTPGTHDWNKFVTVDELSDLVSQST